MDNRRRAIMGIVKSSGGRLPSEFQEVEYLESTDNTSGGYSQWIDTGIIPNINTKLYIEYQLVDSSGRMIFGECGAAGVRTNALGAYYQNANNGYGLFVAYFGEGSSRQILQDFSYDRHQLFFDKGDVYLDNSLYGQYIYYPSQTQGACNLYLFGYNTENQTSSTRLNSCVRIYSCQIYDDNLLIRDFVPCYRKSDNKSGLFDLVTETFYSNPNANPNLLVGNDVN